MTTERKLATVRRIDNVVAIENADAIECAVVGGWNVVIKKGEFKVGDLAVYFEIDSWMPKELAPFLFEGKVFEGVEGARLRTKKLRGVVSQGLLLPVNNIIDLYNYAIHSYDETNYPQEGEDLTEHLGIKKWDKPLSPQLVGVTKGNFPSFIPKTDQERVQNLTKEINEFQGEEFEVTIKLDGSSITVYSVKDGDTGEWVDGVCSRNLDLKEGDSAFWVIAKQEGIHEKIKTTGRQLAFQGEMLNTNIQGNWEKVDKLCMFVYDIYDIDAKKYLLPCERITLCRELNIPHVPVLDGEFILNRSIPELLAFAEGEGMSKGVKREGLVFKHKKSDFSFKAISNTYLLKNKDV